MGGEGWQPADHEPRPGRCNARKAESNGGGLCGNWAGWRTIHPGVGPCKRHGGSAPMVIESVTKGLIMEAARTYGTPIEGVTPESEIMKEIERSAGHIKWLEDRIHAMDPDALVWGRAEAKQMGYGEGPGKYGDSDAMRDMVDNAGNQLYEITLKAGISPWMKLYRDERESHFKKCRDAIRLGLDARRVAIAERQGSQIAAVLRRFAENLQLTPAQMELAPQALRLALSEFADPERAPAVRTSVARRIIGA